MASLLFPDDPQQTPGGPQGLLAIPSGDWRDTIAPQPTQADAADATGKAYTDWLARDRAEQVRLGNVDPDTGKLTDAGWKQQAQVIAGGLGPADVGMATGLLGTIKTYHGSPHLFEPTPKNPLGEFDLAKIGTGEGNQTFGKGMYVAEAEGVAREGYRDRLSAPDPASVPPELAQHLAPELLNRLSVLPARKAVEDYANWLAAQEKARNPHNLPVSMTDAEFAALNARWDKIAALRNALPKLPETPLPSTGHMYEVNLNAEPEHFLHYDKPMSQQSEHVQDAIWGSGIEPTTPYWENGRSDALGSDYAPHTLEQAQRLAKVGIPGIKYLDRSSRGGDPNAPDATHNYAVWSPEIMEIIRRYGIAGLMAGGAATAFGGQQDNTQ